MRRSKLAGGPLVGLLVMMVSTGCDGAGPRSAGMTPEATRDPVIQDIPKPAGFVLVDEHSMAHSNDRFRVANCEYVGPGDRTVVKDFYEEYMPSAGFRLVQKQLRDGEYSLRFVSDTEECTVRVRGGARGNQSVVRIELVPLAG